MNKVVVVKDFALRGIHDVSQNPQEYFALIAQAKQCMDAMCILGNAVVKLIAHDKLNNAWSFIWLCILLWIEIKIR